MMAIQVKCPVCGRFMKQNKHNERIFSCKHCGIDITLEGLKFPYERWVQLGVIATKEELRELGLLKEEKELVLR